MLTYFTQSTRPLVLVAHNLGGLVCVNSISRKATPGETLSRLRWPMNSSLLASTTISNTKLSEKVVGIIFVGTPHQSGLGGTDKMFGRAGLKISDAMNITCNESADDLKKRSANLVGIKHAFETYKHDRRKLGNSLGLISYHERALTITAEKKAPFYVVQMPSNLFGLTRMHIYIPGNHVEMCRFESSLSEGYQAITKQLISWLVKVCHLFMNMKPF